MPSYRGCTLFHVALRLVARTSALLASFSSLLFREDSELLCEGCYTLSVRIFVALLTLHHLLVIVPLSLVVLLSLRLHVAVFSFRGPLVIVIVLYLALLVHRVRNV